MKNHEDIKKSENSVHEASDESDIVRFSSATYDENNHILFRDTYFLPTAAVLPTPFF